jgi:hypothetical protein
MRQFVADGSDQLHDRSRCLGSNFKLFNSRRGSGAPRAV